MNKARQANEHQVRELELYAINDHDTYTAATLPTLRNLANKARRGKYDRALALRAWYHVAEYAAKRYAKEFATPSDWHRLFSVADRRAAAATLAEYYHEALINETRAHIGPQIVTVELHDWAHDMYGNPTAHHTLISETAVESTRGGKRLDVGYSNNRDEGTYTMFKRAGIDREWYSVESAEIDRVPPGRSSIVLRRDDSAILRAL